MVKGRLATINFFTPVQHLLEQVETLMQAQAAEHHPDIAFALDHLLSSGGKRVRPAVTLLTGGMLGAPHERLVTLSAAIELLHTATLVHDDLIDGSILRRGIPTINAQWSPAATVLTGDFIFARAAKLAADTHSVPAIRMFAETLATIVGGELNQLFDARGLANRDHYYRRIYAKTASMFVLATGAAAELSMVDREMVDSAIQFGYEIGMAFQIVDDVLDFTGQQEEIGKPVASDLRQGLITLPAIYYLDGRPDDPDMQAVMNGSRNDEVRVMRLVHAIRESGAIQDAMDEAGQFVRRGLDILQGFPDSEERQALSELAEYIVRRRL